MIDVVKQIASLIFYCLTYEFNAGDVKFSLWSIFMTFVICGIVGYLLYIFIKVITDMSSDD